ncbi:hypothetical protein SAMN05443292_1211 [Halpernia frigidisoli]|uniref:Uncharacterized protein n=1 Tax=Halpernia frigidisoli TaxID=1125876 RepID=A0A1I3F837_9FLAO|nr:hypothetical protein SAMN05443292_1211 [Halpernia frigidisoli]
MGENLDKNKKLNRNNFSNNYLIIITLYISINLLILYKWITFDYDNNYAGSLATQLWGFSNLIINGVFFLGFIIAAIMIKQKRTFYFITAFFAFIPIVILFVTG